MLRSIKSLVGYKILATDGEIGKVHEFFFDDERWVVAYLVVDTGNWLPGRKVLIAPVAVGKPNPALQMFPVALTKEKVKNSPDIDVDKPVSRQFRNELNMYYGWDSYSWPLGGYHAVPHRPPSITEMDIRGAQADRLVAEEKGQDDPHLRNTREVIGYHIQAADGEIGHVEDFILDDETWDIRYMVIDTKNWLPGRKVLISPNWVSSIKWSDRNVFVDLSREAIKKSPEYDSTAPINREFEVRLYDYFGRPKYWL